MADTTEKDESNSKPEGFAQRKGKRDPSKTRKLIKPPKHLKEFIKRYLAGCTHEELTRAFGISRATVYNWLRRAGVPPRGNKPWVPDDPENKKLALLECFEDPDNPTIHELAGAAAKGLLPTVQRDGMLMESWQSVYFAAASEMLSDYGAKHYETEDLEPDPDAGTQFMKTILGGSINLARTEAETKEDEKNALVAGAKLSPAEQYEHYVAGQMIRLLRDGVRAMAPPRTIKEAEVLDRIIRRNLGLSATGGGKSGGASRLTIDLNILNNKHAARHPKATLDAEIMEAKEIERDPTILIQQAKKLLEGNKNKGSDNGDEEES